MKGYVVCVYKIISSEEKLKEYAVKARTAVEKYKGKSIKIFKLFLFLTLNYDGIFISLRSI